MNFKKVKNLVFFAMLILVTAAFLYLLKPFFYPIFWAAVIASIFYPVYKKINAKIKYAGLSSLATIFLVLVIIIIPVAILGSLLIKESFDIYGSLSNNQSRIETTVKHVIELAKSNPILNKLHINEQQIAEKLTEVAKMITNFIFTAAKNLTQNSLTFLVMFIIMIYTLFFFLKDGDKLLKKLMRLSPLGDNHEMIIYKKFTSTARAALKGTLIVGVIQGFLGALLFYATGIEGALIWGIIMMMFSVVPGFGSYIVWMPAALIMFASGNIWQGITIVVFGALVISTIDNFLRPVLVGKDTQMHPLFIFFATLGGLLAFGISGVVIGPVITAFLMSIWQIYEEKYHGDLVREG